MQKETYWAKKSCVIWHNATEWVEMLDGRWNQLASAKEGDISSKIKNVPTSSWKPLYGNGTASPEIAEIVKQRFGY
ncbi:MAG: UDP-N-acetylglucosamine 2-epimerase [Chitinophagaceae bacterium]|nr:UDP-N-acetylglucosamine 2-epimerase [Chitinophagaceae bacterium]